MYTKEPEISALGPLVPRGQIMNSDVYFTRHYTIGHINGPKAYKTKPGVSHTNQVPLRICLLGSFYFLTFIQYSQIHKAEKNAIFKIDWEILTVCYGLSVCWIGCLFGM